MILAMGPQGDSSMADEQSLIQRIRRAIPSQAGATGVLRLGIGDDAALLRPARGREIVLTCDAFLENVHFLRASHPPDSVGYKSLARATSDLAAMGASPSFFLLTLALPPELTTKWLDLFLAGMARAAKEYALSLIGGDTSRQVQIAVSITVIGEIAPHSAILRSGARPGDLLYASGSLGAAQLGLELVRRGLSHQARWKPLLRTHLYPSIRLALGQKLARKPWASAMIDLSDGLSTDLARLCAASHVGARVFLDRIPAVVVPQSLRAMGIDPVQCALHGGDDYELLFAVPRHLAKRIPPRYRGVPLAPIGEITRQRKVLLINAKGRAAPLTPFGWDSFRS